MSAMPELDALEPKFAGPFRAVDLPDKVWPRQEIIDGSLHVTPNPTVRHQLTVDAVSDALKSVLPRDAYRVVPSIAMVRSEPDADQELYLIPDISVLRRGAQFTENGLGVHPEDVLMVVEVLSPSTRSYDQVLKLDRYRALGIEHYWVVEQDTGTVSVLLGTPDETLKPLVSRSYIDE